MSSATTHAGAHPVEAIARRHPGLVTLARAGWLAKGVVYLLLGVIAIPIGWRGLSGDASSDQEASQSGAVARIAESSAGTVALWAIGIGLLLYVLWRIASVLLPTDGSAKAWAVRVGYALSAAVYAALAWSAISMARRGGQSGGNRSEESRVDEATRSLMENPAGRWLVGLAGAVVVVVGLAFVVHGLRAKFRDELEPGGVGPIDHERIVMLGRIGWIGRGIVMAVIGWFLIRAAADFNPDEAVGFDGALRTMTSSTPGALLALLVAVALAVYGAFCVVSAPKVRLKGAD